MIDIAELEYCEFAHGNALGEHCAQIYSQAVFTQINSVPSAEREAYAEAEGFFSHGIEAIKAAAAERAMQSPLPQAFHDGWWAGFKSQWRRCWPTG